MGVVDSIKDCWNKADKVGSAWVRDKLVGSEVGAGSWTEELVVSRCGCWTMAVFRERDWSSAEENDGLDTDEDWAEIEETSEQPEDSELMFETLIIFESSLD